MEHLGHRSRSHSRAQSTVTRRTHLGTIALFLLPAISLLSGCATPPPIPPLTQFDTLKYEQPAKVRSIKEATVVVVSGAVRGGSVDWVLPVGRIFIPMSSGPDREFQFNSEDQQAFGELLRRELVRNGVLRAASVDVAATRDLKIQVMFAQTYHNPRFQEYALDVVVELTGGKDPLSRRYRVISSERDSYWEKWNTTSYEGKVKAARLLLEKMVPDIEDYVAAL